MKLTCDKHFWMVLSLALVPGSRDTGCDVWRVSTPVSDEFTALSIELAFAIEPKGPGSSHGASVDFPRNVSCFAKTDPHHQEQQH